MFVEGAATGTGLEALKSAARHGCAVTGMVSSEDRAAVVRLNGARGAINRRDPAVAACFTMVPGDAEGIAAQYVESLLAQPDFVLWSEQAVAAVA